MLKKEKSAESKEKLQHLFIPSKTVTLVPEFAVEDLPLDRSTTFVPEHSDDDVVVDDDDHHRILNFSPWKLGFFIHDFNK